MPLTPTTLRIVTTTFAGISQISTSFRLFYRIRTNRCWWDDAWAAFSLVMSFILLVSIWIRTDIPTLGPLHQSHAARLRAYWLASLSFTFVLWSARMSVLFSIIRIIPSMMLLRRIANGFVFLFGAMWLALVAQKAYICGHDRSWERLPTPQCHLGEGVGITELTTDFVSDAVLVVLPIRLLWGVSIRKSQRRLLYMIFSAAILTTLVSIVHAYYLLGESGLYEAITANVEASVSLIVANLATILTWAARRVGIYAEDEYSSNSVGLKNRSSRASKVHHISELQFAGHPQATQNSFGDVLDADTKSRSKAQRMFGLGSESELPSKAPFDDIAQWDASGGGKGRGQGSSSDVEEEAPRAL